jgi:addiction module HigA family antidote
VLREDILPALGVERKAFAQYLGISRQMLYKLLDEKGPVTPEMAVRLGKLTGNGPLFWLRLQEGVDLWNAEQKLADVIAKMPTLVAA